MPELPEVETVRRLLEAHVVGRRITGVTVRDFTGVLSTALPVPPGSLLIGTTITRVERRGKYLFFPLDSGLCMIIHLRMTGRIIVLPTDDDAIRFEHAAIHLDSGEDMRFGDQRKFGRITIVDEDELAALDARLGPEPFDPAFDGTTLRERLARRTGSIKGALLDQHLIAGLGNIYVDEALWEAQIHPLQPSNTLTADQAARLVDAIRLVLNVGIANRGTTFSHFENPYGERGDNVRALKVYGRTKTDPTCDRCGHQLEKIVVAGRGTTLCPHCQTIPTDAPVTA